MKRPMKTVQTVQTVYGEHPQAVPDVRRSTTMLDLLNWSYANERVRFSVPQQWDHGRGGAHSNADSVQRSLSLGAVIPGNFGGRRSACHEDAEVVHAIVSKLERQDFWLIVRAAECGSAPDWGGDVELGHLEPVMRGDRYQMVYAPGDKSKRPVACAAQWVGLTVAERDRHVAEARADYSRWWRMVWMIHETIQLEDNLSRWRLTGIGAEREPWTKV